MMVIMIIPPLQSPRQGGSNGGQIIKIGFFININRINSVNNESIVHIYYNVDMYIISSLNNHLQSFNHYVIQPLFFYHPSLL
jgi:hypothetical protein